VEQGLFIRDYHCVGLDWANIGNNRQIFPFVASGVAAGRETTDLGANFAFLIPIGPNIRAGPGI